MTGLQDSLDSWTGHVDNVDIFPVVSDLLMNEAVSEYTKSKIEEKTDDSGNDSGLNSMNTSESISYDGMAN